MIKFKIGGHWLLTIPIFLLFFILYGWRLGSLTSGMGLAEYNSLQASHNINQILVEGINTPYHLLQYALLKLPVDNVLALRLASVTVGLIVIGALWLFLRNWFGTTTAWLATLVFVTTPFIMLTIRSGNPNVMWLWPIVVLTCINWLIKDSRMNIHWFLTCITLAIGLYVPGVIWLVIGTLILGRSYLSGISQRLGKLKFYMGIVVSLTVLSPLLWAIVLAPAKLKEILLVPEQLPAIVELLKSITWSFLAIFWHTREAVDIVISRLAILNILQIVLAIFGIYALSQRLRRTTYIALGLIGFSVLAAGLNDDVHLLIFGLPAIGLFMAAGLRYLYIEWRRIFPLNPFARVLSLTLIVLVVTVHMVYGLRYSLIAWPQTTQTKKTYVLK